MVLKAYAVPYMGRGSSAQQLLAAIVQCRDSRRDLTVCQVEASSSNACCVGRLQGSSCWTCWRPARRCARSGRRACRPSRRPPRPRRCACCAASCATARSACATRTRCPPPLTSSFRPPLFISLPCALQGYSAWTTALQHVPASGYHIVTIVLPSDTGSPRRCEQPRILR